MAPFVSVIVPVRNDAQALASLLTHLRASDEIEVIVSAASPLDDATRRLRSDRPDVTWLETAPGRGIQMNAGASRATGQWLLFLHADSALPPAWFAEFRDLARPAKPVISGPAQEEDIVGGAFKFALDSDAWQARWLERAVAARVKLFNLPYGDQGIFVRRAVFQHLGGFAPIPLMEDVELVQRLKRAGRLRHLTLSLPTSARRWEREGWFRRSARNLVTLSLYWLGVSPERLARRYYSRNGHAD